MGIKAIDYEDLSEGDLITWYGVHVLRWEDEIRPYGIEPTIAFVQDDTLEQQNADLLEALKAVENIFIKQRAIGSYWDSYNEAELEKVQQAIVRAEGE